MIGGLVATPSVSCVDPALDVGNRAVVDLLAGWLDDRGFDVMVTSVEGQANKANMVATLGRGEAGLMLAGHADTVPYDAARWRHDPFALTEADGRWYGLGTSDMKSFFALALEAIRDIDASDLVRPLVVVATADEETTMAGARALVEHGIGGVRHAVIGEPTA
ncbi:MAG: M20/M25/M40 family metallo-hydrolase, partial [Deltaproteobacteria bacterium]|nr:M20/M25/M40 family metallo-hydrolase [Deltaproteobacteria bacterium]